MIDNYSDEKIDIFWVDFDGAEQPYFELESGTSTSIETYSTHAWRLRDPAGTVIADIIDTSEPYQYYQIAQDKTVAQVDFNPCKLPSETAYVGVALGFPEIADRMDSAGTVKAAVLFVDFPDMTTTKTPEQLFAMLDGASEFYKTESYGRLDWQLVPYLTMIRMTSTTEELGLSDNSISGDEQRDYLQEAIDLADPNFDFSEMQAVYVISDPANSPTGYGPAFTGFPDWGITADGNYMLSGVTSGQDLTYWGFLWLNHEVGHTMGLVDLYPYEVDYNKSNANYDDSSRFVGDFGLMGNISGKGVELFAFERWQLGWLDDDQIVCQSANDQTTTLTAIETPGGTKAVMVLTGPTTAVIVESRRALGYDSNLPDVGALVYTIDTSIESGFGVLQVLPVLDGDPYFLEAPLGVGESLTVGNVTVTVTAADENGDTVQVTVAP